MVSAFDDSLSEVRNFNGSCLMIPLSFSSGRVSGADSRLRRYPNLVSSICSPCYKFFNRSNTSGVRYWNTNDATSSLPVTLNNLGRRVRGEEGFRLDHTVNSILESMKITYSMKALTSACARVWGLGSSYLGSGCDRGGMCGSLLC